MVYLQREIFINDMSTENITFPIKLFVYGTLKKEFYNNDTLKGAKYLRQSRVNGIMLHLGNYPGLLVESTATPVEGELWEVPNAEILARVDQLEGHPHHFKRTPVRVSGGDEAYVYEYEWYRAIKKEGKKEDYKCIPSGNWYGHQTFSVPFMGYFKAETSKSIPKTSGKALAHVHIPGQFCGLVDCFTGLIVRDNWQATGKPHLVYDKDLNAWKLTETNIAWTAPAAQYTYPPLYSVPPQPSIPIPLPTPYVDNSDPGEKDFDMRNVA